MNDTIIGFVCQFVLAVVSGGVLLVMAFVIARRDDIHGASNGVELSRVGKSIRDICSKRFLIAILFLPCVVCAAFLYPWAVALGKSVTGGNWRWVICWGLIFIFFMVISVFYMWGRGVLKK